MKSLTAIKVIRPKFKEIVSDGLAFPCILDFAKRGLGLRDIRGIVLVDFDLLESLIGEDADVADVAEVADVAVNVADLSAGVYMVNIDTNAGKAVKKFIKN